MNALQPLIAEMKLLAAQCFRNPTDLHEQTIVGVLACGAFIILLTKMGRWFDFDRSNVFLSMIVVLFNGAVILAAASAAALYIGPKIHNAMIVMWLPLGTAVLILLVVTIPSIMLIQSTRYFRALFCLVLCLAGAALVMKLTYSSMDALAGAGTKLEQNRKRDVMKEMMSP